MVEQTININNRNRGGAMSKFVHRSYANRKSVVLAMPNLPFNMPLHIMINEAR